MPAQLFGQWSKQLSQTTQKSYRHLNRFSKGGVEIFINCFRSFNDFRATYAAASLGYYTVFSIFPLLLVMIIIASFFVDQAQVQTTVAEWVMEFLPFAAEFILNNLQFVFANTNVAGIIALVGLVWSATTVFYTLAYHINLPWSRSLARQALKNRVVALSIIAILLGLLMLSTAFNTVVNLINKLLPFLNLLQAPAWIWFLDVMPFLLRLLAFFSLYKWVPNTHVRTRSALASALIAMLALELTSRAFMWTFQTGLVRYQIVYGTLGSIMTLLFWVYINFAVILFCAHLTASIEFFTDSRIRGRENLRLVEFKVPLHGASDYEKQ